MEPLKPTVLSLRVPAELQDNANWLPKCSKSHPHPNETCTDYGLHLRSKPTLVAVMICVEFPDAPHSEAPKDMFNLLAARAMRWFPEVSYGLVKLQVKLVDKWLMMPKKSSDYPYHRGLSFDEHKSYVADAVSRVESADLQKLEPWDILYVVSSKGSKIPHSPTLHAHAKHGIVLSHGRELRHAVTFGADIRGAGNYGSHILIHETGHLLGLPDCYLYDTNDQAQFLSAAGAWDIMSWIKPGAHYCAYHKLKLGWLAAQPVPANTSAWEVEISALALKDDRIKAFVLQQGCEAWVVEVRTNTGADCALPAAGVLIYKIDVDRANGRGCMVVAPHERDIQGAVGGKGPKHRAPFPVGSTFTGSFAAGNGFQINVARQEELTYFVRIRLLEKASTSKPPGQEDDCVIQ